MGSVLLVACGDSSPRDLRKIPDTVPSTGVPATDPTSGVFEAGLCSDTRYTSRAACEKVDKVGSRPAVYSDAKGGLGLASTTPVLWRLPSREDFLQAYADGAARVLPVSSV